jgi:predicted nucleic acid-binding protein
VDVIVDSSVWIDAFAGEMIVPLERAMAELTLVLSPLVIAELLSGDLTPLIRARVGELLQDFQMHATPLQHWIAVGDLRRNLATRGIRVSIPDAHVAQCALDRDALLLSRDEIFTRIASHTRLRIAQLR